MDIAIHGGFDVRMTEQPLRRTYHLFSGRYPCRILCLFDFCPINELLSVEPETRVHHDTSLYHDFAYFSIFFGVFGAHQSQGFQNQITRFSDLNKSIQEVDICRIDCFVIIRATPYNCVCGRMAGLFPHPHSLENRKYTKYSSVFQTFG